jgi:hypothetical protein
MSHDGQPRQCNDQESASNTRCENSTPARKNSAEVKIGQALKSE